MMRRIITTWRGKRKAFLRAVAQMLCLAMMLGLVPAGVLGSAIKVNAAQSTTNSENTAVTLVPNGDFDRSPFLTHWVTVGTGKADVVYDEQRSSNVMMLEDLTANVTDEDGNIVSNGTSIEVMSEKFAVEAGETYDFSMWIKQDPRVVDIYNANLSVYVFWYNENGQKIDPAGDGADQGNDYFTVFSVPASASWTQYLKTLTVPEGAKQSAVRMNFFVASINCVYVDDIAMTKAVVDNSILVKNGDFEYDLQMWGGSIGNAKIVTSGAYSGQKAAEYTSTGKAGCMTQSIPVEQGKTYMLTTVSKRISGTGTGYMGLYGNDNAVQTAIANVDNHWIVHTVVMTVPENAPDTVKIEIGAHSNNTVTYLIDQIILTEVPLFFDSFEKNVSTRWELVPSSMQWSAKADGRLDWHYEGQYVLLIQDTSKTDPINATLKADVPVTPGKEYTLSYMTKEHWGNANSSLGCHVRLYFVDANGNELTQASVTKPACSEEGKNAVEWTEKTLTAVAPAGAVKIGVQFTSPAEARGATWGIDMLKITQKKDSSDQPEEPITPTTPTSPTTPTEPGAVGEAPHLYFTQSELNAIKNNMASTAETAYGFTWKSQVGTLVNAAESYLHETTVSVKSNYGTSVVFQVAPTLIDPNDPSYNQMYIDASKDQNGKLVENPHLGFGSLLPGSMKTRMEMLALAYAVLGDTRYSDLAIRYAVEMSQWEFWGDWDWLDIYTNHRNKADASVAWTMQGVVAVYDMCYDQLTAAQQQIIEEAIIEKGLKPLSQEFNPSSTANGNVMLLGGMLSGIAAIIDEDNQQTLKPYLDIALPAVEKLFHNYAYSGNTEGHYYTSFGLEYFLPGVAHLYRATGDFELINHDLLTKILPYWTVMFAAPGTSTHPNYGDGSVNVQMRLPLAVISKMTGDPLANYFLVEAGGARSAFENLIYLDPNPVIQVPEDTVAVVNPIGYGALRTGFAADDMLLTLLANNSQMGHNHHDQNSIQFNVAGKWVICDAGTSSAAIGNSYYVDEVDKKFWKQDGHSTILVDGKSQSVVGTGSMEMVLDNERYGYIIGSAPGAYGAGILQKFDRHAIQLNHEEKAYYIIIDDLLSAQNHVYGWQMFNGERVDFTVDGTLVTENGSAQGNNVTMEINGTQLNLSFVGDKLTMGQKKHTLVTDTTKVAGYTFIANSAATKAHQFMTVVSAETAVVVDETYDHENALGALISYTDHLKDLVMFNRTTASATVGDLTTDAQQASILGLSDGIITEGFAATNATTLVYNGVVLVESEAALNIVADADGWYITSKTAQTVKLNVGNHEYAVAVNGKNVESQKEGNMIVVDLDEGDSLVTAQLLHTPAEAVKENEVASTCDKEGSYDSVIKCSVCGEEISREKVTVDKLSHTPADAVRENEIAATCDKEGSYDSVIKCSVCGEEISREKVTVDKLGHTPSDAVRENEIAATCDKEGAYDSVIKCSVCGGEISRETVTVDKLGHTPADAVRENEIAATCDKEGSYDSVIKCSVCGEEISRETVTVDKLGHTPGEALKEKEVAATCDKEGSYESVIKCSVCGEEISRETVTVDKLGHTPAEAVKENEIAATCDKEGSYESVIKCSVCGEEISRETVTVDKLGHTPADAVRENEIAATCDKEGSYENVIKCSVCGEELGREKITTEKAEHDLVHHEAKEPTATEVGWLAYDSCKNCEYSTYVEIPMLASTPGDLNGDDALTDADAIYLLYATFDPDGYPLTQNADFNGDGELTDADAIYLLYATFDPDGYPLA